LVGSPFALRGMVGGGFGRQVGKGKTEIVLTPNFPTLRPFRANVREFAGSILPAQNFLKISFGFLGFILSPGLQRLGLFLKRFSGIIIAGLK